MIVIYKFIMNAMKAITQTQRKTEKNVLNRFCLMFYILVISCMSGVSIAQQTGYQPTDFRGEWFVGLGFGPRIYFADHARQLDFVDRLSLGADLYVGKWLTPAVGTRLGGSFQTLRGAAQNTENELGPAPHMVPVKRKDGTVKRDWIIGEPHYLFQQQFDAWHVYADLLFNVSNIFEGADEYRFWTLVPFVGLGYMRTGDPPYHGDEAGREVSFNLGLLNSLRLGHSVDLTFDIRSALVRDRFKVGKDMYPHIDRMNTGGRPFDAVFSFNIGVAFRFGGNVKQTVVYHHEPVQPVRPPSREAVVERVTEWNDVATDVLVLFRINESTLSRDARVQLGFLARLMHQYPEGTYTITGYADEGTGNPDLNQRLSRARAERVRECLVGEFGISPTRLQTVAAGGIENRYYNDPSLSRSVIIRPNKY